MEWYSDLKKGQYDIVDRVMRPPALIQEQKPRKDRGIEKDRHFTSPRDVLGIVTLRASGSSSHDSLTHPSRSKLALIEKRERENRDRSSPRLSFRRDLVSDFRKETETRIEKGG
ncbi:hypothetical protein Tco_1442483, partial [Tanacetum coccineum]